MRCAAAASITGSISRRWRRNTRSCWRVCPVCAFVRELRSADLFKVPGIAETLDWISSLLALDQMELVEGPVRDTLGALLKYQDDVLKVGGGEFSRMLKKATGVS